MNNTNNESGAVRIQAGDLRRLDHLRDINLTTDIMDFQKLAGEYKSELLDSVLPFWLEHSQDKQYGGYFTCLERDGSVYDTDKFIWLQGREVWLFSMLYNKVEKRPEWLECALQGAEFLKKYGHDGNYNWYFSLTRDGRPLVDPYNIFSYTFATMAFAQLAIASDDAGYAAIAKKTFDRVLEKRSNPKGKWCKAHPGTRPIKDFALPMILCNLSLEIEQLIDKQLIDQTIETCLHEVMEVFYQKDLGLIVENVSAEDNSLVDSFEGRSVNPGHSLEAMWFIMDLGKRLGRPELIDKAVKIALSTIEYGWDKQYGGIFYFMDRLGRPQQQLEWDQKLWWVHIESAITMIKGYQLTGNKECLAWFQKLHDYMWTHFKDPKYPEWFGYLNRRGEVLLPLKGGKWKFIFYDFCWGFQSPGHETLAFRMGKTPSDVCSAKLFAAMLQNKGWRDSFCRRFGELLNTAFAPERVSALIEELYGYVEPEIKREREKFNKDTFMGVKQPATNLGTYEGFQSEISKLKDFAQRRPEELKRQLQSNLGLSDSYMKEVFG